MIMIPFGEIGGDDDVPIGGLVEWKVADIVGIGG